jgi:hypothetical protein
MSFARVKETLSTHWDKVRPVNGICIKSVALFFSVEQTDWIKENFEMLPMDVKKFLGQPPERGFLNIEEFLQWRKSNLMPECDEERIKENAKDRNENK